MNFWRRKKQNVLLRSGDIYKLKDDCKSVAEHRCKSFTSGFGISCYSVGMKMK